MKTTLSVRPNGVITTTDLAGILLLHGDQVWKVATHLHFAPSCWGEVVGGKNYGCEGYEYRDARRIVEFCLANGIDRINADFEKAFDAILPEDVQEAVRFFTEHPDHGHLEARRQMLQILLCHVGEQAKHIQRLKAELRTKPAITFDEADRAEET